jgi:phospholipase/carboxylesterase
MAPEGPHLIDSGPSLESTGLIHRLSKPPTAGPHPCVVMLHGRSGSEDAMWVFARTLPANWLVVSPRGIKPDPAGGFAWHPRQRDEWPPLAMFEEAVESVAGFIRALPSAYGADPSKIFLMGFSQGAATAYATAMVHPGLVRGIVGLVGFVPVQCDAAVETAVLKGLPIFMAVGVKDPYIPHARAQNCARTLRETGADLAYHEYDTGHRLNAQGVRDLTSWWEEQARLEMNTAPTLPGI